VDIVACKRCPRLIAHCREIARVRRRAFAQEDYWGKPVPNFGDPEARLLVVGLAPAAHGGNRTGRIFTGDRSGDWLFRALYQTGFANQPTSVARGDGLRLTGAFITAVNHCAPPGNKLTPDEITNCRDYLQRTLDLLPNIRVVVALGKLAYDQTAREVKRRGLTEKVVPFGHGVETATAGPWLLGSYHPSQQNTFTGRLTEEMLRTVFERASKIIAGS